MKVLAGADPRHHLAITAANEHFTALFAEWMLSHPEVFNDTEPRLKNLWLWHSAEEAEHKCTAFDLYQALGGSHAWRVKWMRRVTVFFLTDALRQTVHNLHTRRHAVALVHLAQRGPPPAGPRRPAAAAASSPGAPISGADFHPNQQSSDLSLNWLQQQRRPVHTRRGGLSPCAGALPRGVSPIISSMSERVIPLIDQRLVNTVARIPTTAGGPPPACWAMRWAARCATCASA